MKRVDAIEDAAKSMRPITSTPAAMTQWRCKIIQKITKLRAKQSLCTGLHLEI